MPEIQIVPLGAGQDVGRSCILLSIGGKNIMLDCGMHMGYNDKRRFPDFTYITKASPITDYIDCVIVSHFHLDHCGALPYMTEMVGYKGPIYMTHPTKAICPILLEDYRRIQVDRKGDTDFFTSEMIKACMKKVIGVNLHQCVKISEGFEIKPYYAGHVLGAAMFLIRVGSQSVVYTGDYNMTPDRHLGAAWIDKCRPDLLITESTYATTIRDSKRCRERDFLKKVHDCVKAGGKVLIPVFALGRAQELCILLESYWERMDINVPIYFSMGLTEKATNYYKLFITWASEKIRKTFVKRNMFEFTHIKPFDRDMVSNPGPMVLFATPGMLHAGTSLQVFKKWAPDEKNMVIMPGYCVAGTVGSKILNGIRRLEFDYPTKTVINVRMSVQYMSFSAHADAKGIMQLIRQCEPANVLLVHGENEKMDFLKGKITQEFGIPCYKPANGETVKINTPARVSINMSIDLLANRPSMFGIDLSDSADGAPEPKRPRLISGALVVKENEEPAVVDADHIPEIAGWIPHEVRFTCSVTIENSAPKFEICSEMYSVLVKKFPQFAVSKVTQTPSVQTPTTPGPSGTGGISNSISISDSVIVQISGNDDLPTKDILISWSYQDEDIGGQLVKFVKTFSQSDTSDESDNQ